MPEMGNALLKRALFLLETFFGYNFLPTLISFAIFFCFDSALSVSAS